MDQSFGAFRQFPDRPFRRSVIASSSELSSNEVFEMSKGNHCSMNQFESGLSV